MGNPRSTDFHAPARSPRWLLLAALLTIVPCAALAQPPLQGGVTTNDVFTNSGLDPLGGKPEVFPATSDGVCVAPAPSQISDEQLRTRWRLVKQIADTCYWYAPFVHRLRASVVPKTRVAEIEREGPSCAGDPFDPNSAVCYTTDAPPPRTGGAVSGDNPPAGGTANCTTFPCEGGATTIRGRASANSGGCPNGENGGGPDSTNYYGSCGSAGGGPFTGNVPPTRADPAKRGPYYGHPLNSVSCQQRGFLRGNVAQGMAIAEVQDIASADEVRRIKDRAQNGWINWDPFFGTIGRKAMEKWDHYPHPRSGTATYDDPHAKFVVTQDRTVESITVYPPDARVSEIARSIGPPSFPACTAITAVWVEGTFTTLKTNTRSWTHQNGYFEVEGRLYRDVSPATPNPYSKIRF